jgi:signal peptidase I
MASAHAQPPRHRGAHRRPATTVSAGRTLLAGVQLGVTGILAVTVLAITVPALFGWQALVVRSGSMGATAPTGSVVLAHPVPQAQIAVGDVVVMRHATSGLPVMHRIVELQVAEGHRIVRTKGDANATPDPDPYILPDTTPVSVVAIPRIGYVIGFLQTALGRWVTVGLAGMLIVSAALRRPRSDNATAVPVPA